MNLLSDPFSKSLFSSYLPLPYDSLRFAGELGDGILNFNTQAGEARGNLLLFSMIRPEEEMLWKSCKEMLEFSVKNAAALLRGFFGFEVLSLELGEKMRSFEWGNFSKLLVNHAKTLKPGEIKLVAYASLVGILKMRIPEEWGKIDLKLPARVLRPSTAAMDLYVKKILKEARLFSDAKIVLRDLSQDPVFRFGEEDQTSRLAKALKKNKKNLPEIFLVDARGKIELGDQFGLR